MTDNHPRVFKPSVPPSVSSSFPGASPAWGAVEASLESAEISERLVGQQGPKEGCTHGQKVYLRLNKHKGE